MHLADGSGTRGREIDERDASRNVAPRLGPWSRLKRGCLGALHAGLETSGLASLYVRLLKVRRAAVLSFHSVAGDDAAGWIDPRYRLDPRLFERRMKFLAARRKPLSLSRLVETLDAGRDLPPRSVVVTLDDGYLDHLAVAGPILAKLGIPATFFLPTACVSRGEGQWVDALYGAFRRRTRHELRLDDSSPRRFDLRRDEDERLAWSEAQALLMRDSHAVRTIRLQSLKDQLRPAGEAPRLILDWDEAKRLQSLSPDFEIGGHTRNHVDLSARGSDEVRSEVAGCAEDLKRELGDAPRHFCYPYERWTPEARDRVRDAGFRSGVGTGRESLITRESDRYSLPRIDPPTARPAFGFVTSGAYPDLSKALTGRA